MTDVLVNPDPLDWDQQLAVLRGHPWQSAHWSRAQCTIDSVPDLRLVARARGEIKQMVRVEARKLRGLGKVAWIRRGPTGHAPIHSSLPLVPEISDWLKRRGFFVAVASPWCQREISGERAITNGNDPLTIWVDLSGGPDAVWKNFKGNWRASVRRAERDGVGVETTINPKRIAEYYDLCSQISQIKGFRLRISPKLIERLVCSSSSRHVETKLFIASCDGQIAAGALVARCGRSIHYLSGGTNRFFSPSRPAEALHWDIIQWALSIGCTLYELEGIDPKANPGVYAFKKKMGGEEVTLVSRQIEPLNVLGRAVAPVARTVLNSDLAALSALRLAAFTR